MSKSDIVFQINYKFCKNKKQGIQSWILYASKKQKADSSNIDEYNLLNDYAVFSDNESFLNEGNETYLWNKNGDISKKDALSQLNDSNSGIFWRGFLSFPSDFAINHGLITKSDYYTLSNEVISSLLLDMGLDLNNVSWYCSLHRDTPKHPHIHFCFFENSPHRKKGTIERYCFTNFRSNVAKHLVDYQKFYEFRDQTFSSITGKVELGQLNKIRKQRLFSDGYRRELNDKLLKLYEILPTSGRLQYNSKNMQPCKRMLDEIIEFILLHDSVKYDYAKYLKLLEEHQRELNQLYGMSESNKNSRYYENQKNKLYSHIGNEILDNFKRYQSLDIMQREKSFLKKYINELNFRSRSDYAKEETKKEIAKGLYKICILAELNDRQIKKVFDRWIHNSHYKYDVESLIVAVCSSECDMSQQELYSILKKLGYDSKRYNRLKSEYFYRELNYRRFINQAMNHLIYELEQEEKQIVNEIQYELGDYK